ncbi:chain-length determining protein [Pseudomonas sp. 10B238]|jgi:chain length determinant protein (polysaccharide antigen chain regulator)|uniref:LPS O-antigen chain length determinant protein WzzB n=1 Tax=Pseudomonadaceae TaxID=135621 RepID=UPI000535E33D|nr:MULTISPECIES: Wzz/FepE/Etk N-terminal domain-containing protein [Pseudomonadaceae]MAL37487.1 chain-length determining protein [Pseudomonas sp.]BAP80163.1 chain length determinant protein [Pseudomonas sp. MT-1]KJJ61949.1 chain-length determining protein [Pseudomonas sp. 10B238]MBK3796938.1 chain-length determining protein [Stutzerimonas stutzeri]MBK3877441.1 chain-length determining protein [Stutzerimonas stutzeri]|tara:strand:+ start:523 stop:1587 length:1065 start_codon:yes stop_codon:yes gene_type:complete
MQETGSYAAHTRDDEIDLVELVKALWSQKLIIVCATIAGAAIALAYALFSTPVYEAKATVLPPLLSDIASYNAGRTESSENQSQLKPFTVDEVYAVFTRNLRSLSLRRDFFKDVYIPSLPEGARTAPRDQLWSKFNEIVSIRTPDKQRTELVEVAVQQSEPDQAAAWANELISRASEASERDMQLNVSSELDIRIRSVERRIASLRSTAQQRREDRIAILKEALVVARAVGMDSPQVTAGRTSSNEELSEFIDGSLTYMRGAKAIEAEMKVLEARESDDPFIPELRSSQEQLSFLKTVEVRPENVSVFTLDSVAEVPETPIKPKKSLIVALGIVLGGMLGVFVALIRVLIRRGR